MSASAEVRRALDHEHLRLLSIGYFVTGGLHAFTALFPLLYVGFGSLLIAAPEPAVRPGQPFGVHTVGAFIVVIGALAALFLGITAALQIAAGLALRARRRQVLIFFAAGLSCLFVPLGTILGVLTFVVLGRPTVSPLFDAACRPASQPGERLEA